MNRNKNITNMIRNMECINKQDRRTRIDAILEIRLALEKIELETEGYTYHGVPIHKTEYFDGYKAGLTRAIDIITTINPEIS